MPVTSGAIASAAAANCRNVAVSFGSPCGITSMRARPSGDTQSRASSDGTDCTVTRSGRSMLRRRLRSSMSGATKASRALSRMAASPLASRSRRPASREAAAAASSAPAEARRRKSVSAARIAPMVSSSDGARRGAEVLIAGPSAAAALWIAGSFLSWSLGTRLWIDRVPETSGRPAVRRMISSTSATEGATMLAELIPISGTVINSR